MFGLVLIVTTLALIGATLLLLGLNGRFNSSEAFCRACSANVSSRAWDDEPRCACGASLVGLGKVRPGKRRRFRSALVGGIATLALSVAFALWVARTHAQGREPIDSLPVMVLAAGLRAEHEWAWASFARRGQEPNLSPGQAAVLLDAAMDSPLLEWSAFSHTGAAADRLLWRLDDRSETGRRTLRSALNCSIEVERSVGSPESVRLRVGLRDGISGIVRVDALRIDGRALPFTLESAGGTWRQRIGVRTFYGGTIVVPLPPEFQRATDSAANRAIDVELTLAVAGTALPAIPSDQIVDGGAPPEAWGINVRSLQELRRVVIPERSGEPSTVGAPSASSTRGAPS